MGALDSVLTDVGSQLGISNNSAGSIMSGLLSFINQDSGGVSGFLDRFRNAGVGGLVTSWLGGDAKPLSATATETVLGRDTISQMASRAGVSFATALSAVSLMLPKLIQRIAPGGRVPTRLAPDITSYITAPMASVASGISQVGTAAGDMARGAGMSRYLWLGLGVVLLGALLALWASNRRAVPTTAVFNIEEQARVSTQRAVAALSALRPGFTGSELTHALNLGAINFATGSAVIPTASNEYLNRAAAAIKTAPAGTVVEVGGHTDNTGDSAANMQLSEQRASAVRDYLARQGVAPAMLTSKGYGDTRPVASNVNEEGRFRNRRIEFSVR